MIFPRTTQTTQRTPIVQRPQILEKMTANQEPRLEGFMLREIGAVYVPHYRQGPFDTYLPGAEAPTQGTINRSPQLNRL